MVRILVWPCVLACGCFSKPELGGSTVDARVDAAGDAGPCVMPDGLALHVPFDEGTGAMTTSSAGSASPVTGALTGATWRIGHRATAASFSGGTSSYVDFGSPAALDNFSAMTACAWVSVDQFPNTSYVVVDKTMNADAGGWELFLNVDPDDGNGMRAGFMGSWGHFKYGATDFPLEAWTHVCGSWNGAAGVNALEVYVDGQRDSEGRSDEPGGGPYTDAAHDLRVGGNPAGNAGYGFRGGIDDVMIFPRALTAAEVADVYNCTR